MPLPRQLSSFDYFHIFILHFWPHKIRAPSHLPSSGHAKRGWACTKRTDIKHIIWHDSTVCSSAVQKWREKKMPFERTFAGFTCTVWRCRDLCKVIFFATQLTMRPVLLDSNSSTANSGWPNEWGDLSLVCNKTHIGTTSGVADMWRGDLVIRPNWENLLLCFFFLLATILHVYCLCSQVIGVTRDWLSLKYVHAFTGSRYNTSHRGGGTRQRQNMAKRVQ